MYGIPSSVLRHTPSKPSTLGCSIFLIKTHSFKKLSTSSESKASAIHKMNNDILLYPSVQKLLSCALGLRLFGSHFCHYSIQNFL